MFLKNNLFDDFFDDFNLAPVVGKMDVIDDDDKYVIEIELPGFTKEDIKISLNDNKLTVTAEKEEIKEERKYVHRERFFNKTSRIIWVNNDVTEKDILPKLENGVLTLEIKKPEEKKPIDIKIK